MSEHIVSGYCIHPILKYGLEKTKTGSIISKKIYYTGPDAVEHFFSALITIVKQMNNLYSEITNTMHLNEFLTRGRPEEDVEDDYVREGDTNTAQSKEEDLQLKGRKVYDHCHWTEDYRGPAHSSCNLQLSVRKSEYLTRPRDLITKDLRTESISSSPATPLPNPKKELIYHHYHHQALLPPVQVQ